MASTALTKKAAALLATTDEFRDKAMAFPDTVDEALALIETPAAAKEMLDQAAILEHYARRVKADTEITNAITYGKLKIIARLGELMPPESPHESGAKGGRGNKKAPSPAETLFPSGTKARYRKVAQHKDRLPDYYASTAEPENGTPVKEVTIDGFVRFATGKEHPHVSLNTGLPEWHTPAEYVEAARKVLGTIDLDPATSEIAQQTVKATSYFTAQDDGLAYPWKGKVWMNPPYSSDLVYKFMLKLCEHIANCDVPEAIVLVNNATETAWFQQASHLASTLCFPAGRVKFLDENGNPGAPLQGQALLYFGPNAEQFSAAFLDFGFCAGVV